MIQRLICGALVATEASLRNCTRHLGKVLLLTGSTARKTLCLKEFAIRQTDILRSHLNYHTAGSHTSCSQPQSCLLRRLPHLTICLEPPEQGAARLCRCGSSLCCLTGHTSSCIGGDIAAQHQQTRLLHRRHALQLNAWHAIKNGQ
jgi:hypothetical protein